jgi:A/G-specific adenine glycosylase
VTAAEIDTPYARPHALWRAVGPWYAREARDLPWRRPDASPWGILVSEVMLQQTPVRRVLPAYDAWLARWPTPAALAADAAGEAVRQWGALGYPRRALRLHAAATAMVERHGGQVPDRLADLRALPGVGEYTASAVASFAFRQRHVVLDTNVRRVLARAVAGRSDAAPTVTAAERALAGALLPDAPDDAATYAVAVMELGAVVCGSRAPRCGACPLAGGCAWRLAGRPVTPGAGRRPQAYAGTDRQVRGRLLACLRSAVGAVDGATLSSVWDDDEQRDRALAGLLADGLVTRDGDAYALPA